MSAEMNNKYDIGNFSKLLDEYNCDQEMKSINDSLFPPEDEDEVLSTSEQLISNISTVENQSEDVNESPTKLKFNLKLKFQFAPYESKKVDIFKIPTQTLTPPREKLS